MHFHEWKLLYFDWNVLKYVPKGPIIIMPALLQIMAKLKLFEQMKKQIVTEQPYDNLTTTKHNKFLRYKIYTNSHENDF